MHRGRGEHIILTIPENTLGVVCRSIRVYAYVCVYICIYVCIDIYVYTYSPKWGQPQGRGPPCPKQHRKR